MMDGFVDDADKVAAGNDHKAKRLIDYFNDLSAGVWRLRSLVMALYLLVDDLIMNRGTFSNVCEDRETGHIKDLLFIGAEAAAKISDEMRDLGVMDYKFENEAELEKAFRFDEHITEVEFNLRRLNCVLAAFHKFMSEPANKEYDPAAEAGGQGDVIDVFNLLFLAREMEKKLQEDLVDFIVLLRPCILRAWELAKTRDQGSMGKTDRQSAEGRQNQRPAKRPPGPAGKPAGPGSPKQR